MSTQPIIIEIVDRIDSGIQAKINGISTSAKTAAVDINNLQAALNRLHGPASLTNLTAQLAAVAPVSTVAAQGTSGLSAALGKVATPATTATQSLSTLSINSSTLINRLATLAGRVVGMELGLGRLGGAFAGVGTAAAGAGPFLIGALAIGATVGAIALYEKFREEANKLLETQTALGKQFNSVNDSILQQQERLVGLTSGPLAEYARELRDLPLKSINVDFSNIQKELEQQHSWWATIIADAQQFFAVDTQLQQFGGLPVQQKQTPAFDIRDTERFLLQQEQARQAGTQTQPLRDAQLKQIVTDAKKAADEQTFNKKVALENELQAIQSQMATVQHLIETSSGKTREINQVSFNALKDAYHIDLLAYQEYLAKKNTLAADAGKAAIEEQRTRFTEEVDRLKASGITTAQDELALRQKQLAGTPRSTEITGLDSQAALNGPLGGNVQKITDEINKLTAEFNKHDVAVTHLIERYKDSILKSGAYSDAMKIEAEYSKLLNDRIFERFPPTEALSKELHDVASQGVEDARVNKELVAIYNEFQGPIQRYADTIKATTQLLRENEITATQAAAANAKAARAMQDAIDPLNEYKIGLQHETELLGQYGEQLNVATEIDRLRQSLQRQGYDLDQKSIDLLKQFLTLLDQQRAVQQDETRLWEANAGAKQKLYEEQLALNKAYSDGVVNQSQYKQGALELSLAQNKLNNEITGGNLKSNTLQIYGGLLTQIHGLLDVIPALTRNFTTFFASLKKGFADNIAQVLVFGGSLKTALLDTARNAVAQLISSLIQLGIEFLIVTALSKAFGITLPQKDDGSKKQLEQLAVSVASIAVVTAAELTAISALMGPAWSLAEAVSLFSFGANAAAATAGIASVVAAGTSAQLAGHFASGGLIRGKGTGTSDDVLLRASNGEFIVNAKATQKNRDLLEALNRNDDLLSFAGRRFAGGGIVAPSIEYATHTSNLITPSVRTSVQMNVKVEHDGSTHVAVEQIDENTVRIIAKQEAKTAVQTFAPQTIASDLHNPNSTTAKAMNRNYDSRRKR